MSLNTARQKALANQNAIKIKLIVVAVLTSNKSKVYEVFEWSGNFIFCETIHLFRANSIVRRIFGSDHNKTHFQGSHHTNNNRIKLCKSMRKPTDRSSPRDNKVEVKKNSRIHSMQLVFWGPKAPARAPARNANQRNDDAFDCDCDDVNGNYDNTRRSRS